MTVSGTLPLQALQLVVPMAEPIVAPRDMVRRMAGPVPATMVVQTAELTVVPMVVLTAEQTADHCARC